MNNESRAIESKRRWKVDISWKYPSAIIRGVACPPEAHFKTIFVNEFVEIDAYIEREYVWREGLRINVELEYMFSVSDNLDVPE